MDLKAEIEKAYQSSLTYAEDELKKEILEKLQKHFNVRNRVLCMHEVTNTRYGYSLDEHCISGMLKLGEELVTIYSVLHVDRVNKIMKSIYDNDDWYEMSSIRGRLATQIVIHVKKLMKGLNVII
uniref:Uncharacterized protein n=1 Tax=viral metagenome TaxID=1070528 RepID=A0A6C0ECH4_9ZZZZ